MSAVWGKLYGVLVTSRTWFRLWRQQYTHGNVAGVWTDGVGKEQESRAHSRTSHGSTRAGHHGSRLDICSDQRVWLPWRYLYRTREAIGLTQASSLPRIALLKEYSKGFYLRASEYVLRVQVRMPKTQIPETVMHGCVMCSPNASHDTKLCTEHHHFLPCCVGFGRRKDSYGVL